MPQTFRSYPTVEIALFLISKELSGAGIERGQEGDIIAMRFPLDSIGLKEANDFLWLRINGLDRGNLDRLTDPWGEPLDPLGDYGPANPVFVKRRYCIPLDRLKAVFPGLDLIKARDRLQVHQPLCPVDTDTPYRFMGAEVPVFDVHGLVYDKALRQYL